MRALYQRRKGRDLFDLWYALSQTSVNPDKIIEAWNFYMKAEDNSITQKQFLENVDKKISDQDFLGDLEGLLRPGIIYKAPEAYLFVKKMLLEKI